MLTAPVAKIDASSTPTPGREHSKKAFGYTAISPYKDLLLYTELQLLDIYVNVKNNLWASGREWPYQDPRLKRGMQ